MGEDLINQKGCSLPTCLLALYKHSCQGLRPCLALDFLQVLEVVRANYDTLTLKLQDGLDQYERYSEQHKEAAFFKELVSAHPQLHPCLWGRRDFWTLGSALYLGCDCSLLDNKIRGSACNFSSKAFWNEAVRGRYSKAALPTSSAATENTLHSCSWV